MIEATETKYREKIRDVNGLEHVVTMHVDFDTKTYRIDFEEYGLHLKEDKLKYCGVIFSTIIGLRSKAEDLLQ